MDRAIIEENQKGSLWEGASLVAGTAIGGGMLAIPLYTFEGGFWGAACASLFAWGMLTLTGLAFVRVLSVSPLSAASFCSVVGHWLGSRWQKVVTVGFLGLLWLLLVAYCAGGGALIGQWFPSTGIGEMLFAVPLGIILALGRSSASRVNSWLFTGMLCVGALFVVLAGSEWESGRLFSSALRPSQSLWALPVLFAAFGFQNVLPTVRNRLGPDPVRLSKAVLLGTTVALALIIGWQMLVFGCLSTDDLMQAAHLGTPVTMSVAQKTSWQSMFATSSQLFAYLAIATSFLGVSQAGLELSGERFTKRQIGVSSLVSGAFFGSAYGAAQASPDLFGKALSVAGGFGVALLNGVLPVVLLFAAVAARKLALPRWKRVLWAGVALATLLPLGIELFG